MHKSLKLFSCLAAILFLVAIRSFGEEGNKDPGFVLTHADVAVVLAKSSGVFDRYVSEDADLSECVSFLNRAGIYFGLMEVASGAEFGRTDAARTMGQVDLVLSGDAEFSGGKVKLPKGIESWEDYCVMNRVEYVGVHQKMREMLRLAHERKG